ncbi:MAG: hypothetical protein ACRENE_25010, partial [Polyangiaceae bacterium]
SKYCSGGSACQPGFQSAVDSDRSTAIVADVAFAVGAAGVAAGVVGLLLHKGAGETQPASSTKTSWAPTFDGRSVGVVGSF